MKVEKDKKIKVIIVEPGEKPYVAKMIKDNYGVQVVLRGPLEIEGIDKNDIALIVNQEADERELVLNRIINRKGTIKAVRGIIILCGTKNGEITDFPENQVARYLMKFNEMKVNL